MYSNLEYISCEIPDHNFNLFYAHLYIIFRSSDNDKVELFKQFQESLKFLEMELNHRKGNSYFANGNEPGMLDYMIWPWIERLEVFPKLYPELPEIVPKDQFPKLNIWIQAMLKDPAVKDYFLDAQIHFNYCSSSKEGQNDYDPE